VAADEVKASEGQATSEHETSLPCAAGAAPGSGCYRTAPGGLQKGTTAPRPREGRSVQVSSCWSRVTLLHPGDPAAATCVLALMTPAPVLGLQLEPYGLVDF